LDQSETIAQFGLRGAPEVPFTPYKTFQTTIAAIEKLTKLTFAATKDTSRMSLSAFDPLATQKKDPRLVHRSPPNRSDDEPMVPLTHLSQILVA
jgi:hypothetical protein